MLRRLRDDESGFSLMELMTAMAVGSVVLTALMTIFVNSMNTTTTVNDRVDNAQRGRLAIDRITSLLDSQVCFETYDASTGTDSLIPPVQAGSDGNAVTFYADLNGASDTPSKYQVVYDPTAKTLTEKYYKGTGTLPSVTYPTSPTRTTLLASSIMPSHVGGVSSGAQLPIFQYYAFSNGAVSSTALTTPLTAATAATAVRVNVQFQAVPTRTKTEDLRSAWLSGQGDVLTANPVSNTVC